MTSQVRTLHRAFHKYPNIKQLRLLAALHQIVGTEAFLLMVIRIER
jgi:hypothetical protein